jgi:acyl-CoA reductase-like NAD-dependent aldehyde dehydrogenase
MIIESKNSKSNNQISITQTMQVEIDRSLRKLQANKDKWVTTNIDERIAILDEIRKEFIKITENWVSLCSEAKGIQANTYGEGFEWNMTFTIFGLLASLSQSLKDIKKYGVPRPAGPLFMRADDQVAAKVFPRTMLESLYGLSIEVHMIPGVSIEETLKNQSQTYKERNDHGKVALILGAGNASALQIADILYKLFIENHVVILKMNPVNSYLKPLLEKALSALTTRGFLYVISVGQLEGEYLCHHPIVEEIHLTGSGKTFEAIVFGSGTEGDKRKSQKNPLVKKPITGELGNITPVIIVPGPWTDDEIKEIAVKIVSWLSLNAGCNCFTPRVIIQHKEWIHHDKLVKAFCDVMKNLETRKAFYPGSMDRFSAFISAHPDAKQFGDTNPGHLPWTFIKDVSSNNPDDICFNIEAFCSILTETSLEAANIPEFINKAVDFANNSLWGSLTATIFIHPKSILNKEVSTSIQHAIKNLRYGTIGINEQGILAYAWGRSPWGAFPGHNLYDIQSGIGFINNYLMFDKPQKTVVYGPLKTDTNLVSFKNTPEFHKKYTYFLANPSIKNMLNMLWAQSRG